MSALVHLAAPPIRVANVIRQRCAWCGALIEEDDLERMAFTDDGSGENPLVDEHGRPRVRWEGLVSVSAGNPQIKLAVSWPKDGEIPDDSCMNIDDAVTG